MVVRAPPLPLPSRYRNVRPIGHGGMAEIYRATDTSLGRDVAVKVLAEHFAEDEDIRARFVREGLAGARLSDGPNTVSIFDVGDADGRPFLVMEYLSGGSIASRLAKGRVSQAQALAWLEQTARALDAAHARGVVHRDVKPGNLLLDADGNVHVADFGIARADGLDSRTQTGVILGTAGYLAPEQARGETATAASDRYALAVVAQELLAGRQSTDNGAAPLPGARDVFARALSTRPEERFPSCAEFVAALRAALSSSEAPTVVARPGRRRRKPLLAAALVPLGVLGYFLTDGLSSGGGGTQPPPPRIVVRTVTVAASTPPQPVAEQSSDAQFSRQSRQGKAKGHHGGHGKGKDD